MVIHSMEYSPTWKRNAILTPAIYVRCKKTNTVWCCLHAVMRIIKFTETESWMAVIWSWGAGQGGIECLPDTELQCGKTKNSGEGQWWAMVPQKCECTWCHRTVHLEMVEMVSFMLYTFTTIRKRSSLSLVADSQGLGWGSNNSVKVFA